MGAGGGGGLVSGPREAVRGRFFYCLAAMGKKRKGLDVDFVRGPLLLGSARRLGFWARGTDIGIPLGRRIYQDLRYGGGVVLTRLVTETTVFLRMRLYVRSVGYLRDCVEPSVFSCTCEKPRGADEERERTKIRPKKPLSSLCLQTTLARELIAS